jgi:hypothetical protein
MSLLKELDKCLLDLAWSLWTELGVAGVKRKHQKCLITLEELIVLTVAMAKIDPRLRDESLDWCTEYHHFISISRLKLIMKSFGSLIEKPFSSYAATLNAVANTHWPLFTDSPPLKFVPSRKSCLRPLESPALINIRSRSLFGTGARADLVTFFVTHAKGDFSAADMAEIGYSKRNLAEILEEFALTGLFEKFSLRNQQRYRLAKNDHLVKVLDPLPDYAPSWWTILEVLLSFRDCIRRTENNSESTKVVEIRNLLQTLERNLQKLNLKAPLLQTNFQAYLDSVYAWLLEIARKIAEGHFSDI